MVREGQYAGHTAQLCHTGYVSAVCRRPVHIQKMQNITGNITMKIFEILLFLEYYDSYQWKLYTGVRRFHIRVLFIGNDCENDCNGCVRSQHISRGLLEQIRFFHRNRGVKLLFFKVNFSFTHTYFIIIRTLVISGSVKMCTLKIETPELIEVLLGTRGLTPRTFSYLSCNIFLFLCFLALWSTV